MNTEHDDTTGPDDTGRSWNSRPPEGDELNRLLVSMKQDVLTRAAAEPRTAVAAKRRRRLFGITFGVIALVAIGGTSGAIALGMIPSPFEGPQHAAPSATPAAPSTTPTPKPTVTAPPVAAPNYDPPAPRVPLSCTEVGAALGIPSLLRAPEVLDPFLFEPQDAALTGAGLTTCRWGSSSDNDSNYAYASVAVDIVPAPAEGKTRVASRLASGAKTIGIGDASASACTTALPDDDGAGTTCTTSVVTPAFWFELEFFVSTGVSAPGTSTMTTAARGMTDALAPLTPGPAWAMPTTSWSPDLTCADLAPRPSMSSVLGVTLDAHPSTPNPSTAISDALGSSSACDWVWNGTGTLAEGQASSVSVGVTPGGRWAYDKVGEVYSGTERQVIKSSEPVTIAGAQAAVYRCGVVEGEFCWLDVLHDDSWIQIGFGDSFSGDAGKATLVKVAEAVLARHEGGG